MKKINPLIILALTLFISSCCHNENVTCQTGILQVHVVGIFETSSPIAIRYKQDNAFDVTIDTLVSSFVSTAASDSNYLTFQSIDATQPNIYLVNDSLRGGLLPGYDYKILFPADSLTYAITNLNPTGSSEMEIKHCGDTAPPECFKNVYTCTVNGVSAATFLYSQTAGYQNAYTFINLVK